MSELLKAVHNMDNEIHDVVAGLEHTAFALQRVGLDKLAQEITYHVKPLLAASKYLLKAYDDDLTGQIRHGEAVVGGMLKLALDGHIVPKGLQK